MTMKLLFNFLYFFSFLFLNSSLDPLISLPKGLINQTIEEAEYLSFHKCVDSGEAYGASYIITKEHLILQETNYSLGWVNCEMASFIMVRYFIYWLV